MKMAMFFSWIKKLIICGYIKRLHKCMKKARILLYALLLLPLTIVSAQEYNTLLESPLIQEQGGGFSGYLNAVYLTAIGAAALLAVVKIIIAGIKYMLSDVVTNKESAKKDIKTALLGLVIIVAAVMILTFINPKLTNFDFTFIKLDPTKAGLNATSQKTNELLSDLDECVVTGEEQIGTSVGVAIGTKNCSPEAAQAAMETFATNCREKGDKYKLKEDGTGASCGAEIAVERWGVDEYSASTISFNDITDVSITNVNLSSEYLSWEGSVATYDADTYCRDNHEADEQSTCLEAVENLFIENNRILDPANAYCENNGGRKVSDFSCQLPKESYTFEEAASDYTGDNPIMTEAEYASLCRQRLNSQDVYIVDTARLGAAGIADSVCVIY
jgi:hypothetical protein